MSLPEKKQLLKNLNDTVKNFVKTYNGFSNFHFPIDSQRTAKDVLMHIVFWHESFSRNTFDMRVNNAPNPLKGSYAALTDQCKSELSNVSVKNLILRFDAAHKVIQKNILSDKIVRIPYRVGSRDYTPEEHLDVVNRHVSEHLKEVQVAYSDFMKTKQ